MNARALLRRQFRQLGWYGMLGAGLLAFEVAFYVSTLLPAQTHLEEMRSRTVARQAELRQAEASGRDMTPSGQLQRFHQSFPAEANLPDWLDRLFAVAKDQGIDIERGEYKVTRNAAGRLVRIQITLPVKSDYLKVRKFIASVKSELPLIALERVHFERQKVAEATVEAKLGLVIYMEQTT